jgi:oligosaccharide repeat unit polymerase
MADKLKGVTALIDNLAARKASSLVVFLLYKLVFDWTYVYFITPYGGAFMYNPSFLSWLISTAAVAIVFLLIYDGGKKFSSSLINIFILVTYVPLSSFFAFSGADVRYFLYVTFCWILIKLLIDGPFEQVVPFFSRSEKLTVCLHSRTGLITKIAHAAFWIICVAITGLTAFGMLRYTDFYSWLITLDIERIYEVRQDLDFPVWFAYVQSWQANAVNPVMATYFLLRTKHFSKRFIGYLLVAIPVILQAMIYLSTGHRGILLSIPLYLLVFVMFRAKKPAVMTAALIILGIIALNILFIFSRQGMVLHSLVVRRTFFVQPPIEFSYFNFFQDAPHLFFSEGRLGSLLGINSPYPLGVTRFISFTIQGTANTGTNTGFMASAFADMGFAGMALVSSLFAVFIKFCCVIFRNLPLHLTLAALIVPVYSLVNSNFFTSMLTHGIGIATFLVVMLAMAHQNKSQTAKGGGQNE